MHINTGTASLYTGKSNLESKQIEILQIPGDKFLKFPVQTFSTLKQIF